ncbi:hypothetical protein [Methylibium sp.]|uniref:hypothetical protein n=1 Tax=Methylibium sp. TaxID=2067992 RepID=UPI003D0F1238
MIPTFTRLQLATRIHFTLLRTLGEGIDVGRMLRQRDYADEVASVCRSLNDYTLYELADRFEDVSAAEDVKIHMAEAAKATRAALARIPSRAPQDLAWSQDTSGFGLSRALTALDGEPTPARSRFSPSNWLGIGRERAARH